MKKLFLGILIVALFSCSNKERVETTNQLEFTFSVKDSVTIDPGNEFLYLSYGANFTELDENSQFLYNYNRTDNSVEVIDLDELKLVQKIQFEEDGPHGTGGDIQQMAYKGQNHILLAGYHQIHLFNPDAEKVASYKIYDQAFLGDSLLTGESLSPDGLLDNKGEHFITTYAKGPGEVLGIAKIRLSDYMLKKTPVPGLMELAKFRLVFSAGGGMAAAYPGIFISPLEDKTLISSTAVNEAFTYDPKNDSLHHYSFNSRITPNRQKESLRVNLSSQEEFQKIIKERSKDVSFGRFTYDSQNQRYYRISQKFVKEGEEENIYQPILSILDKNFNQIFETDQLPLEKMFRRYFVKDGKLWLFENMEDEMGFIVMDIEEQ